MPHRVGVAFLSIFADEGQGLPFSDLFVVAGFKYFTIVSNFSLRAFGSEALSGICIRLKFGPTL